MLYMAGSNHQEMYFKPVAPLVLKNTFSNALARLINKTESAYVNKSFGKGI